PLAPPLCRAGRAPARRGDWTAALAALDEALGLWRGEPLVDVCSPSVREVEVPRIEELRLVALDARPGAKMVLGRSRGIVGELRQLVRSHPLRERFHAQLMQ